MTKRLANKKVFITAAAQGIGRSIAERFIVEGADVIATDVDLAKLADLHGATCLELDVRNSNAVLEMARKIGAVDVLVNVAGFVHHGTILDCDDAAWDFSFDLNVKSMHRTISSFLPPMIDSGGGSIINLSSVVSSMKAAPNRYVYAASKAAIIGLTRSIALDFIKQKIRCNAICPGTVDSPSWQTRVAELGKEIGTDEALRQFVERQPMGRVGTTAEIASLALYLASDDSAFTTGTAIAIDGGFTL